MALQPDIKFPFRAYGFNSCMCNSYVYLHVMYERAWVLVSVQHRILWLP